MSRKSSQFKSEDGRAMIRIATDHYTRRRKKRKLEKLSRRKNR